MATYEVGDGGPNIAYKGIAVRLDAGPGRRVARPALDAVSTTTRCGSPRPGPGEGFIDWNGINFNGQHQVHPRLVGEVRVREPGRPRLGQPGDRQLRRPPPARPRRPALRPAAATAGPLQGALPPRRPDVLSYTVGEAEILETPGLEPAAATRTSRSSRARSNIGKSPHDLPLRVAPAGTAVAVRRRSGRGGALGTRRTAITSCGSPRPRRR